MAAQISVMQTTRYDSAEIKKMGSGRVALDFGEKGSDDVFWALEIRLGQRL